MPPSGQPKAQGKNHRCALLLTGRNSVRPCTTASTTACHKSSGFGPSGRRKLLRHRSKRRGGPDSSAGSPRGYDSRGAARRQRRLRSMLLFQALPAERRAPPGAAPSREAGPCPRRCAGGDSATSMVMMCPSAPSASAMMNPTDFVRSLPSLLATRQSAPGSARNHFSVRRE